jgi:DNA processing protein
MKIRENIRSIVALSLIPAIGAQRIRNLLLLTDQAERIFAMPEDELLQVPGIGNGTAGRIAAFRNWKLVDQIIEKSRKNGYDLITIEDDDYPSRLNEIYDPPVLLWCRGNRSAVNMDGFSVVGTRNPSRYGRQTAKYFTDELISNGFSIISGLAYGIDSIAHQCAVDRGSATIAVLGSGINRIYPTENIPLVHSIMENGGAIISEFPPGTKPDAGNFPVRNRIVSGMSFGTLVIETAEEGGSMITANLALEQNREVFIVPHQVDAPKGRGCNTLIRSGAGKLVQTIDDILVELPFRKVEEMTRRPEKPNWQTLQLDQHQVQICKLLEEYDILHVDQLSRLTEIPVNRLLGFLLELELLDCVKSIVGKQFQIK